MRTRVEEEEQEEDWGWGWGGEGDNLSFTLETKNDLKHLNIFHPRLWGWGGEEKDEVKGWV